MPRQTPTPEEIRSLHRRLLDAWNNQDGHAFGSLFAPDGSSVGFDGSTVSGSDRIGDYLSGIFADHRTASFVAIVREVRFLAPDVALLRAEAGMVPPGGDDINPATNAIQTLVAVKQGDGWRIALFQNTPAAFHGRPEAGEALTGELRSLLA
jgi:uncharacterized protein (TIGR02246 family)